MTLCEPGCGGPHATAQSTAALFAIVSASALPTAPPAAALSMPTSAGMAAALVSSSITTYAATTDMAGKQPPGTHD